MPRLSTKRRVIDRLIEAAHDELEANNSDSSDSTEYNDFVRPLMGEEERDIVEADPDCEVDDEEADNHLLEACLGGSDAEQGPVAEDEGSNTLGEECRKLGLGSSFELLMKVLGPRYLGFRRREKRNFGFTERLLQDWKVNNPARFRRWVRINPDAFDDLVGELNKFDGFHNNSHMRQTPVAIQVAIALVRFGGFGNRAGIEFTADLFGVSYGLVQLATNRVIMAALSVKAVMESVRWPTQGEKDQAKEEIMEMTDGCEELSRGWLIMDGSLIRIYQKPHYCGSMFFDRKCRYSMNVQVTTMPNGQIIDYTCGHVGSAHDSFTLRSTRLYNDQKPEGPHLLLAPREFCWGDSAYTMSPWLVKPFSEKEVEHSKSRRRFNRVLARIRVRSEHAIGYLKGRFQSLHGLRIIISNEEDMSFSMQWIRACIHLHMYCFYRENISCDPSESFCRRGYRRLKKQKRALRRAEAQRSFAVDSYLDSRQSQGYSRRFGRLNLELGKEYRDRLCSSYKAFYKQRHHKA